MAIKLDKPVQERALASIKRYFEENGEEPIGDLRASLLLGFVLEEIGPSIYNQAVLDAQARMQENVTDLDGTCHEPEFTYWTKK